MIQTTREKYWVRLGISGGNKAINNLEITHLQYADDALVFCGEATNQILILRVVFIVFEVISGLNTNWGKSYIYPINEVTEMDNLEAMLGERVRELATT